MERSHYTSQKRTQGAVRFTFSYEGTALRLVSRQRVDAQPQISDRTYEYEGQAGFWFELRDVQNRVLYRLVMHNPIESHREAPSGDPERPFTHIKVAEPQGVFAVMAPDLEEARSLLLYASPSPTLTAPAKEIGRFDLQEGKEKE
jgi:hypothetical protein